jgi:cell division protein FtsB
MVARIKRNKKRPVKKMLGYFAFAAIAASAIIFLGITNWKIYKNRAGLPQQVQDLKAQVQDLQKQKDDLEKNLSNTQTEDYLEGAARNQLDMKKPGEDVYVVQKELAPAESSGEEKQSMSWWDKIKSFFIK